MKKKKLMRNLVFLNFGRKLGSTYVEDDVEVGVILI
jgi:hypothetical protein